MIHLARAAIISCVFAPLITWAATGSQPWAWAAGAAGGAAAWTTRLIVAAKGRDARP